MIERFDFPVRIRIAKTVNPLSRLPRWETEQGFPPCPAGTTVLIERLEVNGQATLDVIESAYLNAEDTVIVAYRQESGNLYYCLFCEFSLGEAAIILKAVDELERKTSDSDRHVEFINKWAHDFRERLEKEYANRTP